MDVSVSMLAVSSFQHIVIPVKDDVVVENWAKN